jgi:hypothetical protein
VDDELLRAKKSKVANFHEGERGTKRFSPREKIMKRNTSFRRRARDLEHGVEMILFAFAKRPHRPNAPSSLGAMAGLWIAGSGLAYWGNVIDLGSGGKCIIGGLVIIRDDIEVCWIGPSRLDDFATLLNERLLM